MKLKSNNPSNTSPKNPNENYSELGLSLTSQEDGSDLSSYLNQLYEEGFGEWSDLKFTIPWENLYGLLKDPSHISSVPLLKIPSYAELITTLNSSGSLTDSNFLIAISSKSLNSNSPVRVNGAIAEIGGELNLITEANWRLWKKVKEFARADASTKPSINKLEWGHIRLLAKQAGARMDHFLSKTIVLTPEKLDIGMKKVEVNGVKVVEILPAFTGCPLGWIKTFDGYDSVQNHYEVADADGLVHLIIDAKIKTVLTEIKRMPGRRVSGKRAEAFIRNPYALLGDDAADVVSEGDFEQALNSAGITFSTFTSIITKDNTGVVGISLLVASTAEDAISSQSIKFLSPEDVDKFILQVELSIKDSLQCCFWDGWELEIRGDTPEQVSILKEASIEWRKPKLLINYDDVYDLSHYSERIDGIGKEKPYYSPFIAKNKEDEGWFPDNITYGLFWNTEGEDTSVGMVLDKKDFTELNLAYIKAKEAGLKEFSFPGFEGKIPVAEIEPSIEILKQVFTDIGAGTFSPPPKTGGTTKSPSEKMSLLLKPNIAKLDYQELRNRLDEISLPENAKPKLPKSLRSDIKLLDHQVSGIAWLQHLWSKSPEFCRGAVMADDMGLGKTLQLLTFIASCIEENSKLDPILIIAPVSLLENWENEIKKFFTENFTTIRTLYGSQLSNVKISKSQIDSQLTSNGLSNFLRPDWLGNAKVVLTTYETLRDLEFSFAAQKWSIMICDEAQKIKNPNAMVTRSAKKMNVRFKIACTGTPVENSLTDLWCLFDFVQPGMLGALNEFSTKYRRRPFEANTEEEKSEISELRQIIEPQILRRTKDKVAKDLPKKEIVRKYLSISNFQRTVYGHAIGSFKPKLQKNDTKDEIGQRFKNHLGLLHYLRQVCADPRPIGQQANINETLAQNSINSPKMSWLIEQIELIRAKQEKVIIFTEFRDIQRLIQKYIREKFLIDAEIINGDTAAISKTTASRQKKLDIFQAADGFSVIILSPLAVGFGVNIQKANHVIHFTRMWNPAKEDQATDRAYRIGQKKDVFVYYPIIYAGVPILEAEHSNRVEISPFKTFDVKLDELLEWKRSLSHDMLNGTGDVSTVDFIDLTGTEGGLVIEDRLLTIDDVIAMKPDTFEIFCAVLWNKTGYPTTYKTPQSGDGGIDVVAIKGKSGQLLQCKTAFAENATLGWDAIKEVTAGEAAYSSKHLGVIFTKTCVTNRYFNSTAYEQAKHNDVNLIDQDGLKEMILQTKISLLEIEQALLQYL